MTIYSTGSSRFETCFIGTFPRTPLVAVTTRMSWPVAHTDSDSKKIADSTLRLFPNNWLPVRERRHCSFFPRSNSANAIYLFWFFFFFWLHWVFVAVHGLSPVAASGGYSLLQCAGFSCCGALALGMQASVVVARGLSSCGSRVLECRLSSCGARAQLLRSMRDLPGPGLKPVPPALAGGFLTTAPPGKSQRYLLLTQLSWQLYLK